MTSAESWSDLGFTDLQKSLDEQSTQIKQSREDVTVSRKALTSQTKAFRKLNDEEKLNEIRGLLKQYQTEIDTLTTRCKFAETCFMDVYRALALLPDPSSMLESQASEIAKLRVELQERNEQKENSESDVKLARELERQVLRVSQLERQIEKQSSEQPPDSQTTQFTAKIDELENKLAESKAQTSKSDLRSKEYSDLADKHFSEIQRLERELNDLQSQLEHKQPSKLEKSEQHEEQEEHESETLPGGPSNDPKLRRQIKKLEAANAILTADLHLAQSEAQTSKSLVSKLESDLTAVQHHSDTFSTISGWTAIPRQSGPGTVSGHTVSGQSSMGGQAVSGIIGQQRDRYKQRVQELEEQQHELVVELDKAKKQLRSVTTERQGMYELVRKLQAASPNRAQEPKSLYEPTTDQKLKDLELDRMVVGLSPLNAKIVEGLARAMVDEKLRIGGCAYIGLVHLLALYGLLT